MTDLRSLLFRLDKPLQYAVRNDYANLARLRELESYVRLQLEPLRSAQLPDPVSSLLAELAACVAGFEKLALPEKRLRVQRRCRSCLSCPC